MFLVHSALRLQGMLPLIVISMPTLPCYTARVAFWAALGCAAVLSKNLARFVRVQNSWLSRAFPCSHSAMPLAAPLGTVGLCIVPTLPWPTGYRKGAREHV